MNTIHKLKHVACASVLMLASIGNASATLVNFEFTGTADFWADPGNIWGLTLDDTITASGTFDDSAIIGGNGNISFDILGNTLSIFVGNQTYTAADDDLGLSGPSLTFSGGALTDFDFATTQSNHFFDSLLGTFDGEDDGANQINGTWNFSTLTITPVPVPAAVWLFGSGLLGLVGVARRKAA